MDVRLILALMASKSLKKIISNISWLAGDKVLDVFLRVTVGVLVARYMGVEWFGYLHFSLAMVALLIPVVTLGLTSIVVKRIVLDSSQKGRLLGTAFVMQFVTSLILSAGLVLTVYFFDIGPEPSEFFVSILAITLIFHSADPVKSWNQSQLTSKYTVWAKRLSLAVGLSIRLLFIQFSVAFIYFIWAWVVEAILKAYFMFHFYRKNESLSNWTFDRKIAKTLFKESWPIMFSSIASVIYLKIDVVMMGSLLTGRDVGLYSAAVRISDLFYFIPAVVTSTLLPTVVRSSQLDEDVFRQRVQALLDLLTLYSILVVVFLWFGADRLVAGLFGAEFLGAGSILQIHAFAIFFVAAGSSRNVMLIAENRTVFIMLSTILGAVINIAMNLFLIPLYSGIGAAIATVVSYAFSGYLACVFWKPTMKHFKMISASFFVLFRPMSLWKYLIGLRST